MSNRALSFVRLLALSSVTACCMGSASAQTATGVPVPGELVTKYLQQDIFLKPGIGFDRVRIGDSFEQVQRRWGRPESVRGTSFLGTGKAWVYGAGQNAVVIVSGGKKVKGIEIVGDVNSPLQSSDGVRFGMTPQQVTTIYGPTAADAALTTLTYANRGIKLTFKAGGLRSMYVFAANR